MERVILYGMRNLKDKQRYMLNKIVNEYYAKIGRQIKNDFTLKVTIKDYQTSGKGKKEENKQKKISMKAQVLTAAKNIEAKASDWDLNRTAHALLKKILGEVEHTFRPSEQGRK